MVLNYRDPKTQFQDLIDYYKEIEASRKITFSIKELNIKDPEIYLKLYKNLGQEQERLRKEYEKKLHKEDYYGFEDLNELEMFLMRMRLFPKREVDLSVKMEKERIQNAKNLKFNGVKLSCWLTKSKNQKIKYVTHTGFILKNANEFFSNYEKLI